MASSPPKLDIDSFQWHRLTLVPGDQETSFACPSCGASSGFSPQGASSKDPQPTGRLQPVGQTVRLTNGTALFFDQIVEPQPLIRSVAFMIGIVAAFGLMWFWSRTVWEGTLPWWGAALALIGGWFVMRVVQPALSPRLAIWRFNCAKCGAGYLVATDGTHARVGDDKDRIVAGSPPGGKARPSAEARGVGVSR